MNQATKPRPGPKSTRHEGRAFAAALLAERRQIAMAFRAAGATEPSRATTLEAVGLRYNAPLHELTTLGVLHVEGKRYWFDETKFASTVETPRFRVIGIIVIAAIFLLLVVALVGVITASS